MQNKRRLNGKPSGGYYDRLPQNWKLRYSMTICTIIDNYIKFYPMTIHSKVNKH